MTEPDTEIAGLSSEQIGAWHELLRAGLAVASASPGGQELVGSGFHQALQTGAAWIRIEIELPSGHVIGRGHWPEFREEAFHLFELVPGKPRLDG